MLVQMPRKIRGTLTKTNDCWILQKAFVPHSCHFLTFNSHSVGVFGQTVCSKRGRITTKKEIHHEGCLGFAILTLIKKTDSAITFSIELEQNHNNLSSMAF
jgi:hypothetical protein